MKSFHGKQEIKDFYINRIKEHAKADEIIKGQYWSNGKGCAVGCTIHSDEHRSYETELGIPKIIAHLEDKIFENLPNNLAKTWPLRFLESINVGVDLSKVWPKFAIYLLTHPSQSNSRHEQCKIVADAFEKELAGEKINWDEIKDTADAYAVADAYAAAYAAYAAYAVAGDDADAAGAGADAYAAAAVAGGGAGAGAGDRAATYKTARERAVIAQSEKLLELLRDAKE